MIPDQEDDAMEGETLKRTTEISISAAQMGSFLKFDSEDGPLKTLEKRLEVCGPFLGSLLFVVAAGSSQNIGKTARDLWFSSW